MKDHKTISVEFGLPELAFEVFTMVTSMTDRPEALVLTAPHYAWSSSAVTHEDQDYHTAMRILLDMNLIRIVTEQDQDEIRAEIDRKDIYSKQHTFYDGVPGLGAVEFTKQGAKIWIEMQYALADNLESASRLTDFFWSFRQLSRLSETRGLMLHLQLATRREQVDLGIASMTEIGTIGAIEVVDIHQGVAPKPWRMSWWSLPAPCHYRLVQIHIDRQKWWPKRERSMNSQYRDIDHFRWFMQLDWELPPLLSGKMSGEKAP